MRRTLFTWHGIPIYSYPTMLYLGMIFGIIASNYASNITGLDSARVFIATLFLLIPALAGARLLYVATHWEIYRTEQWRIWQRTEGGMAMYGGVPLMMVGSLPLLTMLHLPFGMFWDVTSFTILVSLIFGRIGCFLNGCCCGRPSNSPLTLYLPNANGYWDWRIPSQLLEAAWAVILLIGAAFIWPYIPTPGGLFAFVVASYSAGRFVLEFTREEQAQTRGLTVSQQIALILIASAIFAFVLTSQS